MQWVVCSKVLNGLAFSEYCENYCEFSLTALVVNLPPPPASTLNNGQGNITTLLCLSSVFSFIDNSGAAMDE